MKIKVTLTIICIALAITAAFLYLRWQDERYEKISLEFIAAGHERDSRHYQDLYYETIAQYHDCQNQNESSSRWQEYLP